MRGKQVIGKKATSNKIIRYTLACVVWRRLGTGGYNNGNALGGKRAGCIDMGWLHVSGRYLVRIAKGSRPTIDIDDIISGANRKKEAYRQICLFNTEDNQDSR